MLSFTTDLTSLASHARWIWHAPLSALGRQERGWLRAGRWALLSVQLAAGLAPALFLGPLLGWFLTGEASALRVALAFGLATVVLVPAAGVLALVASRRRPGMEA